MQRTTIVLDEEAKQAAQQLARRYQCSTSEAIRRAVVRHRDAVFGVPPHVRLDRRATLDHLFRLFEANDAGDEIARLKREDEGF